MNIPSNSHEICIDVRVNGWPFRAVQVRHGGESVDDFDVVIDDSFCGLLTLEEHFLVELRRGCDWERVTLTGLKDVLLQSSEFPRSFDMPTASEVAELRMFEHSYGDQEDSGRSPRRLTQLRAYDRCLRRVKAVLRDEGISCVPCGGVFVVADRARARAVLLRAGFQRSTISAGALLEPFGGCSLYLLERPIPPPGSSQGSP